jgi:hypothetical protein
MLFSIRDRDRIRTYDRLLRRQVLYPAELRDLIFCNLRCNSQVYSKKKGMISHPLVGVARFELTASCSQSRRDTGLRYTPKKFLLPVYISRIFLKDHGLNHFSLLDFI